MGTCRARHATKKPLHGCDSMDFIAFTTLAFQPTASLKDQGSRPVQDFPGLPAAPASAGDPGVRKPALRLVLGSRRPVCRGGL